MNAAFTPLNPDGLPVFHQSGPRRSLFYAPGYLVAADADHAEAVIRALNGGSAAPAAVDAAVALRGAAAAAVRAWEDQQRAPFAPVCLTLYLHNECNLACVYCYANPTPQPAAHLSPEAIAAGARLVASTCAGRGVGMTGVWHGGGEPTLHRGQTDQVLDLVEAAAQAHGVPLFRYLATNGVLSADKAAWVARRFDRIGLSCDGPSSIQDRQRPRWGGGGSAAALERTAQIVHAHGTALHVRVTLTPDTLHRQTEIAEYLCTTLRPQEIHVEPVYRAGRRADALPADLADTFVEQFWQAQSAAAGCGVTWTTAGSRTEQIHGPYCHVFRDVLNLIPGDAATACFTVTRADEARSLGRALATLGADGLHVAPDTVTRLRQRLTALPERCQDCFNRYHCARGCPEACPLNASAPPDFACRVSQRLTQTRLERTADAWTAAQRGPIMGGAL